MERPEITAHKVASIVNINNIESSPRDSSFTIHTKSQLLGRSVCGLNTTKSPRENLNLS